MATTSVDQITGYGETLALKAPCRLATTANIVLSGLQAIDGVVTAANDRVLVRDQDTPSQNGIYIAASGAWQRARDMDSNRDLTRGTRVYVTEGDSGPAEFEVTTESPITVGSSSIAFDLSAGSVNAAALSAAAQRAEEAADVAEGLASTFILSENTFDTKATAAAWSPIAAPNYIRTAGALAVDDGSGVAFVKGTGSGGFTVTLSGGGTQDYKPSLQRGFDIRLFGAGPARTAAQNSAALTLAMSYVTELWVPPLATGEYIDVNNEVTVPAHVKIRGAGWHSRIRQTVREKNIFIAGDHCSFEGLHLIGDNLLTGADFTKNNGIYASGKKGVLVQNCFGEKFESCGVQLRGCLDYKILNNVFFANPWGAIASSGDIVVYSTVAAGRGLISGNSCFSNNSQGMFLDALGYEAHLIITNNHCVTLDPATCIEGGTWAEATVDYTGVTSTVRRRHGIVVGYNSSSVGGPHSIISNNICKNTRWTGIYKQGVSEGGVLIIGNHCSNNGLDNSNSISGGIFVNGSGKDLVTGNIIEDFQNTTSATGAITINTASPLGVWTKVHGNLITNSLGRGIALTAQTALVDVAQNQIIGSVSTDIEAISSGAAGTGGHHIHDNKIKRTSGNDVRGIRIQTGGTTLVTIVERNSIAGFDNTNAVNTNAGIWTNSPLVVRIRDNHVKNFHVAISSGAYFTVSTRFFDLLYENNLIEDCTGGFGLSSSNNTVVVPLVGNRFINVTNKTAASATYTVAGTKCGYICRKDDDRLVVLELTAAPAVGTWAAGDRAAFPAPAAAAAPGAICTTAGNPGTWKAEAAIAA
ncbi:right-handed parallel beta-helix repeat-containing protein [Mesorhizobium sp. M1322]|uniref:right-handed parallel beta-helix repeat-containing protein n=1 Tax=Mesorhizobium sp. M1322 TaxID=2957081 RepID=UPI00333CFA5C